MTGNCTSSRYDRARNTPSLSLPRWSRLASTRDASLVRYVQAVGHHRLPGSAPLGRVVGGGAVNGRLRPVHLRRKRSSCQISLAGCILPHVVGGFQHRRDLRQVSRRDLIHQLILLGQHRADGAGDGRRGAGGIETTSVRRADLLGLHFLRSAGPVSAAETFSRGKAVKAQELLTGIVAVRGGERELPCRACADLGVLAARAEAASGCSRRMVRTRGDTHGWAVLGTQVSRLRWWCDAAPLTRPRRAAHQR